MSITSAPDDSEYVDDCRNDGLSDADLGGSSMSDKTTDLQKRIFKVREKVEKIPPVGRLANTEIRILLMEMLSIITEQQNHIRDLDTGES